MSVTHARELAPDRRVCPINLLDDAENKDKTRTRREKASAAPRCAVLCCVVLLQLVVRAIEAGDKVVLADALRIGQYKAGETVEVQDLAGRLFHTVFMGTENSSGDTRSRYAQGWGRFGRGASCVCVCLCTSVFTGGSGWDWVSTCN